MKTSVQIILWIAICLAVGYVGGLFQSESINSWYPTLVKSTLTPPPLAFPIAWTILYVFMGVSIALVLSSNSPMKNTILTVFIIQLILNFAWSILFFFLKNPLFGLADIILLEIIVVYYIYLTFPKYPVSAWLFIPYALWLAFAGYLNLVIYLNN